MCLTKIIWLLYWVSKIAGLLKIFFNSIERMSAHQTSSCLVKNKVKMVNIITVKNKKNIIVLKLY